MKKENLLDDEEKKLRLKASRRKWRLNNKEQVKQKLKEKNITVIKVRKVREKMDEDIKKERMKESQKIWRENNKEKVKEIAHRAYIKKVETDPTFKPTQNEKKRISYEKKKHEKEFIKLDEIITKYF
jgi:hypothetical protein